MSYRLIRVDPVHRVFELKFVTEIETDMEILDIGLKSTDPIFKKYKHICETKLPVIIGDKVLVDDINGHYEVNPKVPQSLMDVGGAKYMNKIIVNYKKFTGSYKPFWLEYMNDDGVKVIETNIIPESKSLKVLKKHYDDYLNCYNNIEHMNWFIHKIIKYGRFGGFHIREDGCVYNESGRMIYEFDRF